MEINEQLEIVESHWYPEALAFKNAGDVLRYSVDGEQRSKALGERLIRLQRANDLLDAWLDIKTGTDMA